MTKEDDIRLIATELAYHTYVGKAHVIHIPDEEARRMAEKDWEKWRKPATQLLNKLISG